MTGHSRIMQLAYEGMEIHEYDAPEYKVCAALIKSAAEVEQLTRERQAFKDAAEFAVKERDALRVEVADQKAWITATGQGLMLRAIGELSTKLAELEKDAALGRIAIKFVDRAGDYCDVDPAERICDEFYKAMADEIQARFNAAMKETL